MDKSRPSILIKMVKRLFVIIAALNFLSCQVLKEPAAKIMRVTLQAPELDTSQNNLPTADYNLQVKDQEGNSVSMEAFRNKVIFLNFWATWCLPCVAELPSINKLYQELEGEQIVFLLISDESSEKVKKYRDKKKMMVPFYTLDKDAFIPEMYGHNSIPTTFIINKKGELVRASSGAEDWNSEASLKFFRKLL